MKVYVKKGEYEKNIVGIFVTILFLAISIGIFTFCCSYDSFWEVVTEQGLTFLFALVFLAFALYFLYNIFKKPRKILVKLIEKIVENYNGKEIVYMTFTTVKEKEQEGYFIPETYTCYTYGNNELTENNQYIISVKEFNRKIIAVDELNHFGELSNNISTMPNITLAPVVIAVGFIFGGLGIFSIIGLIMYSQYMVYYILTLIFSVIALLVVGKGYKIYNTDNKGENSNLASESNYSVEEHSELIEEKAKVGNVIIKEIAKLLLIIPVIWAVLVVFIIQKSGYNLNDNFAILAIPVIFLDLFAVLSMIPYINIDNRLIKKYKLNINHNIDITQVKAFRIFRAIKNITYEKFFIVDENNNLLYKIQKKGSLKPKYLVIDSNDIKQGEINKKIFSLLPEYFIKLIGVEPYSVQAKFQFPRNYNVVGREYSVKGNIQGTANIICNMNGEELAIINATQSTIKGWSILGSTEVEIVNSNNQDITLIAFCVTHGNLHSAIM